MYLRTTKVKRPNGHTDEYLRLVESYWNQGRPRHRVVCNLGRKDLLAPHAEALLHLLKGEDAGRLASQRPRVRVKDRQLRQWYGTLDRLGKHQKHLEKELFLRLRNLFSLKVDLVFYDLTSTYFEGNGPAELAKHGYSRDGK